MSTVLSGTSGALYYTPAGTSVTTLTASAFPASASNITVGSYLGFKVNDPVTLAYPAGATVTNAIPAGAYFVKTYVASTGIMTLSSTAGGSAVTATAQPSGFGSSFALSTGVSVVVVWVVFGLGFAGFSLLDRRRGAAGVFLGLSVIATFLGMVTEDRMALYPMLGFMFAIAMAGVAAGIRQAARR